MTEAARFAAMMEKSDDPDDRGLQDEADERSAEKHHRHDRGRAHQRIGDDARFIAYQPGAEVQKQQAAGQDVKITDGASLDHRGEGEGT